MKEAKSTAQCRNPNKSLLGCILKKANLQRLKARLQIYSTTRDLGSYCCAMQSSLTLVYRTFHSAHHVACLNQHLMLRVVELSAAVKPQSSLAVIASGVETVCKRLGSSSAFPCFSDKSRILPPAGMRRCFLETRQSPRWCLGTVDLDHLWFFNVGWCLTASRCLESLNSRNFTDLFVMMLPTDIWHSHESNAAVKSASCLHPLCSGLKWQVWTSFIRIQEKAGTPGKLKTTHMHGSHSTSQEKVFCFHQITNAAVCLSELSFSSSAFSWTTNFFLFKSNMKYFVCSQNPTLMSHGWVPFPVLLLVTWLGFSQPSQVGDRTLWPRSITVSLWR